MTLTIDRLPAAADDKVLGLFYPALGLVRYNFDWRKYGKIEGPISNNQELVDEYGTIHHEIYHYLQTISTTYCYLLFLLEKSKAAAYWDLIAAFKGISPSFHCPFWAWLNLPETDDLLSDDLRIFRDTRFQHGNSAHILQELFQKGTRIKELTPALAHSLTRFGLDGLHHCAECPSGLDASFCYDIEADHQLLALDEVKVQITGEMVLENAAFMISTYPFWHDESGNSTALALEAIQSFGTTFYARLIERAARVLQIERASFFKNTFLAIADVALNIPISREVKQFRWIDLHPGWRFLRALEAARALPPIRSYSTDYSGFVSALCNELRWQTPLEIAHQISTAIGPNWLDHELIRALRYKCSHSCWKYFDPGDDLFIASEWIAQNFPPMVEDSANKKVVLTRKNELASQTIDWYFEVKIPQRVMLDQSLAFFVPGLEERAVVRMVSEKLRSQQLDFGTLSVLPKKEIERGYTHYGERRKYYSLPLRGSSADVFFRS